MKKRILLITIILIAVLIADCAVCYFTAPIKLGASSVIARKNPVIIYVCDEGQFQPPFRFGIGFNNSNLSFAEKQEFFNIIAKSKLVERGIDLSADKIGPPKIDGYFHINFYLPEEYNGMVNQTLKRNPRRVTVDFERKKSDANGENAKYNIYIGTETSNIDCLYDLYETDYNIKALHEKYLEKRIELKAKMENS